MRATGFWLSVPVALALLLGGSAEGRASGKGKPAARSATSRPAKQRTRPPKARAARDATRRGDRGTTRAARRPAKGDGVAPRPPLLEPSPDAIVCPDDMVAVAGRVCVDRFEISLEDGATGARWSPYFSPDLARATTARAFYESLVARAPEGSLNATMALPELPAEAIAPRAVSKSGATPQGYLSGDQADAACRAAGKRLCTESEWVTACRGERRRDFPYGDRYQRGACNVDREGHPSALLHGNAARFHDDPRNNRVAVDGRPLLRTAGETATCASRWGDDALYDMVGNLDEWVADPSGVFVGGFYARGTRAGCWSRVSTHVRGYSDYSLGARCCAEPVRAR